VAGLPPAAYRLIATLQDKRTVTSIVNLEAAEVRAAADSRQAVAPTVKPSLS